MKTDLHTCRAGGRFLHMSGSPAATNTSSVGRANVIKEKEGGSKTSLTKANGQTHSTMQV